MGASFQAPHAAPRQRQMETSSSVDPGGLFGAPCKSHLVIIIIMVIIIIIMGFGSKKN